jgi:ferredoxin
LKVSVDKELCIGHGRCYDVAPELFEDDEEGYAVVRGDGSVPRAQAEPARLAVRLCPERAVTLTEQPARIPSSPSREAPWIPPGNQRVLPSNQ